MKLLLWLAVVQAITTFACSHMSYQNLIPNGGNVINPCTKTPTPGVGHYNSDGGGPRNEFGERFEEVGYKWTKELCREDTDNDGKTNGFELGDPNCQWVPGATPSRTTDITHPAISNLCDENMG